MRIGCVTHHNYPTGQEIRTTKTAAALSDHDCEVTVFCPGRRDQSRTEGFVSGKIIRFRPRVSGVLSKCLAPLPINPLWFWWLLVQFRNSKLDLVVVRDLRLALPVYFATRVLRIPAILDIGEHYPGMMEVLGKQNLLDYLFRNNWLITKLEAISVRLADVVWVVVEENRERLKRYSSEIVVISNFPVATAEVEARCQDHREFSEDGEPVRLLSLGLIDNIRGLDLAIEAFAIVVREINNVEFLIFGDGDFRPALEAQVRRLGLVDKVKFGGWVQEEQKFQILAKGDIGLILHKDCALTQHTVPNKLFDYMYAGLPVISTKLGPVTRILEKEDCGVSTDESPAAVAKGLLSLIADHARRKEFSENGREAVCARYRWESESAKLIKSVIHLIGPLRNDKQA